MAKKSQKTEKQEEIKDKKKVEEQVEAQDQDTIQEEETTEEPVEEKSTEEILNEKLAELQDKYLRLTAEYDNYRRRTLKEKIDMQESSKEEVFKDILPVIDDLERALVSIESANDVEAVKQGMNLIYSKFTWFLNKHGINEIEAVDKELDTDQHEAVTKIPVENKKQKGKIVDVIEKGYKLKDKVIRFAKVVIGE